LSIKKPGTSRESFDPPPVSIKPPPIKNIINNIPIEIGRGNKKRFGNKKYSESLNDFVCE